MLNKSLLLLLLTTTSLHASIYRWVDDQGNIHFSDKPPAHQASENIDIRVHHPRPDPDRQERLRRQEYFLESQQEQREDQQRQKQQQAIATDKAKKRCQQAQQRLDRLTRSNAIYQERADGSRYYYNEQERDATLGQARRDVDINCK